MKHAPHWSDEPPADIRYSVAAGYVLAVIAGMLGGCLLTAWVLTAGA